MVNVIRWNPFDEAVSLRQAMDRLLEDSFVRPYRREGNGDLATGTASLPIDLYETDDAVVLKGRLPGVNPEDVEISIDDNNLVIKADLRSDATLDEAKNWSWHRHELFHGAVGRSIALPTLVQHDKAEASFRNGELTLVLPKAEQVKPRTIKVKAIG